MNSEASLVALHPLLKDFVSASGLKINKSKSIIMLLHLPHLETLYLQQTCEYKWVTASFKYMGIHILILTGDLLKLNHDKAFLGHPTQSSLWNKSILTWNDRYDILKSFLLPKLLFFQTIPVFIPPSTIHKWQQILLYFLCANKKHKVGQHTFKT